jgi:RNA polymerase sigma factor (sigma-70 family)
MEKVPRFQAAGKIKRRWILIPDNELMTRILQGCLTRNRVSQKELYLLLRQDALNIAYRYEDRAERMENIIQESFFYLFSRIQEFPKGKEAETFASLRGWFRRIVVDCSLSLYLQQVESRYERIEPENKEEISTDPEEFPPTFSAQDILQAIRKLPSFYRLIWNLHVIDGRPEHEILEALHMQATMFRSSLHKAREILRNNLLSCSGKRLARDFNP